MRAWWSSVDVTQDEVEAGQHRDDVGYVDAAQEPRQDRDVRERRRADLHSERSGRTLADDVVAHLAERVLGVHPDLALGHLDDARDLRHDRAVGELIEELQDHARRFARLLQTYPV